LHHGHCHHGKSVFVKKELILIGHVIIRKLKGVIMPIKRTVFIIILLGIMLSACKPAQTPLPTAQPFPSLSGDWTIKMTQSGGIMGMLRSIEIQSDGKSHIEDARGKQSTDRQLNSNQMKQLTGLVNSARLQAPGKPDAACADCFIYDLQITSGGQTFATQLNDISLPNSGLEDLVHFLSSYMNDLLVPV
jgi:hypothetical protein